MDPGWTVGDDGSISFDEGVGLFDGNDSKPIQINPPQNQRQTVGCHIEIYERGGRKGPTYGATITVETEKGFVGMRGSSWPNPGNGKPGIEEGDYDGVYRNPGVYRTGAPGVRVEDGGLVPTVGPNSGPGAPAPGQPVANGVVIHCGASETNRGSSNCLTIEPSSCDYFLACLR